jgi:hypothetical protein
VSVDINDVLALDPDWTQPVNLRLRFITEIDASAASQEQRTAIRPTVSLGLSAFYDTLGREQHARKLVSQLRSAIGRRVLIPLWSEAMKLASPANATASISVVDASNRIANRRYALLWTDYRNFEQVEVASVAGNTITLFSPCAGAYAAGAYFVPGFVSNIVTATDLGANWNTANWVGVTANWDEEPTLILPTGLDDQDATVPTVAGTPLFPLLAEWNTAPAEAVNRPLAIAETAVGLRSCYPLNEDAVSAFSFQVYLQDRDEIALFTRFFERIMGRKSRFWHSLGKADFVPVTTAASTSTLTVADTNFFEREWLYGINADPPIYTRAFVLVCDWKNLVWQAREIISVAKGGANEEVLTLNATIPRIAPDVMVSQLMIVRSTLDEVALAFRHSEEALTTMSVQELSFDYAEFHEAVNASGTLANTRRVSA